MYCRSLLVIFLFGVFTAPVRAQVEVEAPTAAAAKALDTWYAQHIPQRYRASERLLVRELSDTAMDSYLQANNSESDFSSDSASDTTDIDGIFESSPDRLTLRVTSGRTADLFTFAHEYGHYVWFHLLSEDDRRRYEALYKRQRSANKLVTRYAATDVEEGYAEAFSFYVIEAPMLQHRDPASYQFLAHWRFPGF